MPFFIISEIVDNGRRWLTKTSQNGINWKLNLLRKTRLGQHLGNGDQHLDNWHPVPPDKSNWPQEKTKRKWFSVFLHNQIYRDKAGLNESSIFRDLPYPQQVKCGFPLGEVICLPNILYNYWCKLIFEKMYERGSVM